MLEVNVKPHIFMSDFTFGFELEGFVKNTYDGSYEVREAFKKHISNDAIRIQGDGSIRCGAKHWSFEIPSPIMRFTPRNLNKVLNLFNDLPNHNIHTNNSCGLHFHIGKRESFNKTSKKSVMF